MMTVCSALDRVSTFADVAPNVLHLPGRSLLRPLAPDTGTVLNPTYDLGFAMTLDGTLPRCCMTCPDGGIRRTSALDACLRARAGDAPRPAARRPRHAPEG